MALFQKSVADEFGRMGFTTEQIEQLSMQEIAEYYAYRDAVTKAGP